MEKIVNVDLETLGELHGFGGSLETKEGHARVVTGILGPVPSLGVLGALLSPGEKQ